MGTFSYELEVSLGWILKLYVHGFDCLDPGEGKSEGYIGEKKVNQWALEKSDHTEQNKSGWGIDMLRVRGHVSRMVEDK